jgi:FxsC-like protein
LPAVEEINSAFHDKVTKELVTAAPAANVGPRYVRFIFVAGRPDDLRDVRDAIEAYDQVGGEEWQPFMPNLDRRAGVIAMEVVSSQNLLYRHVPLDAQIVQHLAEAEKNNEIAVVVVDPWTVGLPNYRQMMNTVDQLNIINCIVMVPWNLNHPMTKDKQQDLFAKLKAAFPRKTLVKDPVSFLDNVNSLDDLKRDLSVALTQTRGRMMSFSQAFSFAAGGTVIQKPSVSAAPMG